MDLKQLRYFLEVVEAKSLTKAADVLHVAQPAIGMQIRKLEDELDVKLLVRHARGVMPTEAGERLVQRAETLLRDLKRVQEEVSEIGHEPRGTVSLGMTGTVMYSIAGDLVESCRDKYPGILLSITEGMTRGLAEYLGQNRLDVALAYVSSSDADFVSKPLAKDMFIVVHREHELANRTEITMRELLNYDLIMNSRRPSLIRTPLEVAAKAAGVEPRVVCESDSVITMKELVRCKLGCAGMPFGAARLEIEAKELFGLRIIEPRIF